MTKLKAPFPAFGGKSRIAAEIWRRFGSVRNYVEPFCRSCAVLLGRPLPFYGTETVNDLDGWVTNFWRALQADPAGVAHFADWPVSELDLHARGDWLFYRPGLATWLEQLRADPEFYDVKSAGWWVWGMCCWIGTGWTSSQIPQDGTTGQKVSRQIPGAGLGRGTNRQSLRSKNTRRAFGPQSGPSCALAEYLQSLSDRLRNVRICCGDWTRVCGLASTVSLGLTAVFLDPPYGISDRTNCYGFTEDYEVAAKVRAWCMERGREKQMRIALCGYSGEHDELETAGWSVLEWKADGGCTKPGKRGNANRDRERVWFSPCCVTPEKRLF